MKSLALGTFSMVWPGRPRSSGLWRATSAHFTIVMVIRMIALPAQVSQNADRVDDHQGKKDFGRSHRAVPGHVGLADQDFRL